MMIAFVFPGQGSQRVGMGRALAEAHAAARQTFEEADDALGFSISELCFEGPGAELQLTANAQPAILTATVATLRALRAEVASLKPAFVAGHSLGEYSALVAAGALRFADALRLVNLRGRLMQAAVPAGQGAMAAVIGLEPADVEALCAEAGEGQVLETANFNGGGQIVIAGAAEAVTRALRLAKVKKARALPLKVSAPFHCSLMEPAAKGLRDALEPVEIGPLAMPVVSNVDAEANGDPARVKDLLYRQVTAPVRWEASITFLQSQGVDRLIEIGPGKVLCGLARRIDRALATENVESIEQITALAERGGARSEA